MRVLLDECVTRHLAQDIAGHDVQTIDDAGLKGLKNGDLLRGAAGRFDALLTVGRNIAHQRNPSRLGLAVIILVARRNSYAALRPLMPQALETLKRARPGEFIRVG